VLALKNNNLIIFNAGSLSKPLAEAKAKFLLIHPSVTIQMEASGSLNCARKITEQKRIADLVALADYTVFEQLMMPYYTDWYAMFASNEMVLCYTDKSKYANGLTTDNWHQILLRTDVQYTHTDPDQDPAGYRALMVWQLAEYYYGVPGLYEKLNDCCSGEQVCDTSSELIARLRDGRVDYAFEYISVAKQNGFKFINLPEHINLSSLTFREQYKIARVLTTATDGRKVEQIGQPIIYALSIPKNAANPFLAREFARFFLGAEGQRIMRQAGQTPIPAQFIRF
jgi:molybdate/tungstate transport system substrate-binding protein